MWKHWAFRTVRGQRPFQDFEFASGAWRLLRESFPNALCAVLMPNHLHLILPSRVRRERLSAVRRVLTKRLGLSSLWDPLETPEDVPDLKHLRRQIRYIALNPCRDGLCRDPLEWIWSTYRDMHGASADPWVTERALRDALDERGSGFLVRFHAYVSGDPSVRVDGTPPPRAAVAEAPYPLADIMDAARASLRMSPSETNPLLRQHFVHLAGAHGWTQTSLLGQQCGLGARAIQIIRRNSGPSSLAASSLCLGDSRLRSGIFFSPNAKKMLR